MKIGVDAGCLGISDKRLQVGVFQVVKNLLVQLGKLDKKNEYFLYSFQPIDKKILRQFGPKMKNIVVTPSRGWLAIWLPMQLFKDKPDVFLALNQAAPLRLPMQKYKTVGLFYDVAFEKYPELYSYAASVSKHSSNSKYLASSADEIIAISESTKNDLHSVYKIPNKKIHVAYPGITELPKRKAYKDEEPYFLFVGAFKKSKNVPVILRAFQLFVKQSGMPHQLILVGSDRWPDDEIGQTYANLQDNVQERIRFLSFVDEKLLSSLYKGATALVSPSIYEGFGLPFLEAQSLGCPVIGSSRGSLPEIIGKSGILVNPNDEKKLFDAMIKMTIDSVRTKYKKRGLENSKKYSWKTFAKQIQSTFESKA